MKGKEKEEKNENLWDDSDDKWMRIKHEVEKEN